MDELRAAIQGTATEAGFSGVVQIDEQDQTLVAEAFGLAHRGFEIPNTVETQFAIASGTKGFTALMVVSLIVDELLALDTTARSVLGHDLPLIADDVTVEHLLAHTSGIGDYIDEEDGSLSSTDYLLKSPVHALTTTDAYLVELDGYPTKFPAGKRFSYCNAGYVVLALIAERVSSESFHDLVTDRVLSPAALEDTRFLRSDEASGRMATGYLHDEGLRTNVLHLPVVGGGDGGIYTTTSDMHQFWTALDAAHIVPDEWVANMTAPHSIVPDEEARYGWGFWLAETGPVVSLVGGDAGVSFTSLHDPTTSRTATVISNTPGGAWRLLDVLWSALS